jgi:hypothetical protein
MQRETYSQWQQYADKQRDTQRQRPHDGGHNEARLRSPKVKLEEGRTDPRTNAPPPAASAVSASAGQAADPCPSAGSHSASVGSSTVASTASPAATAPRRPTRLYRNEEVLLFRTPTDASHLVLFNLPSRPFIHSYYDLKTVAAARKEAEAALRRERGQAAAVDQSATTAAGPTAGSSAAPAATATAGGVGGAVFVPASASAAALCQSYHALHLLNLERVLHALSKKYGLVHELSLHCKARDADSLTSSRAFRRSFDSDASMVGEDAAVACPLVEEFENGFNLWAFIKYYSVLHAAHAAKELSRTQLIPSQRIKANFIKRNSSPSKGQHTPAGASTTASIPASGVAPPPPRWYPLAHHRCLDLCNYFLGFNNWNCRVHTMRRFHSVMDRELVEESPQNEQMNKAAAKCNFAYSLDRHSTRALRIRSPCQ